jgi:hypothetical protein
VESERLKPFAPEVRFLLSAPNFSFTKSFYFDIIKLKCGLKMAKILKEGDKVSALVGMSFYKGVVEKIDKENSKVLIKLTDPNSVTSRLWVKRTNVAKLGE